jgi:hypothetical protein
MDGSSLQDLISRGMGNAARKLGSPFIVYRPRGPANPTASRNRIIKLFASFNAQDESYRRVSAYGEPGWWGVYDASYTRPGDYLVGVSQSFFVSAQRPILPVQCVLTNRTIDLVRPVAPQTGGYAGLVDASKVPILTGWPASVLAVGGRSSGSSTDPKFGQWILLLPQLPLAPEAGDVVNDDLGQAFVVGSTEQSDLGWRVSMRQISA